MTTTSNLTETTRPIGPRDRESFFTAQRRNRRATWRISFLCAVAAIIMGLPLTLVLTPLGYSITLIIAEIVNYFSPLPAEFWQNAHALARLAARVGNFVFDHKPLDPQSLAIGLAAMLLPGIVITLLLWMVVHALFRRGGVGGALAKLNAREPNQGDLKELQLADVVQEMAIAAGLPAPRVMLIDSAGTNAAAIGTSPNDATIVVSRPVLDRLTRDELQGLLGHLVASIGNGDLSVAFTIMSVFETCGLLLTLINSPFGPKARRVLWQIVRFGFSRSSSGSGNSSEADAVATLLTRDLEMNSDDITEFFDSTKQKKSLLRKVLNFVFFPIFFTNTAIQITLWFFLGVLLGPGLALLWRTRRYLADATAVQLTRYPDGLAGALEHICGGNAAIAGATWASHLFVVNPVGDSSLGSRQPSQQELQMAMRAWADATSPNVSAEGQLPSAAPTGPLPQVAPADYAQLRARVVETQRAAMQGDPRAIAQMASFARAVATMRGGVAPEGMPDPADILAAQHGDRAAIARLLALSGSKSGDSGAKQESSGLQNSSIISFHPSLKRRLKRLQRMGAQVDLQPTNRRFIIFAIVLWLLIGPPLLLAAALMLVVIAMMVMLNLLLLMVWLAVIHGVFGLIGHH
jgi:Zn-dependent protease with chaperone function